MSANFQAFAAAFLNRTTANIREASAKEEEYRDELKKKAEEGKLLMAKRRSVVDQALGLANQAKALGATPEMIEAAVASGANGLVTLTNDLSKIKKNMGDRWDPEVAKTYAELPEGFTASGMPIDELLRNTYGLKTSGVGSTKAKERTFWQEMFGKDYKEAVRAELDKEGYYQGSSMLDLTELAAQEEYKSLVPGTFMSIASPKFFDPENADTEMRNFDSFYTRALKAAEDEQEYIDKKREYDSLEANKEMPDSPAEKAQLAKLKQLQSEMAAIAEKRAKTRLQGFIEGRMRTYNGGGYLETMGSMIDEYLGEGAAAALMGGPEEGDLTGTPAEKKNGYFDTEIKTEELDPVVTDQQVKAAGGSVQTTEDGNMLISHPSLERLTGGHDTIEAVRDQDGNVTSYNVMVDGEPVEISGEEDVNTLNNAVRSIKAEEGSGMPVTQAGVDPTTLPVEEIKKLSEKGLLNTNDLKAIRDTVGGDKKLRAAGLPESILGSLFSDVPKEDTTDRIESNIIVKHNADPEAWYVIKHPEFAGKFKVKGSDLALIPDAVLTSKRDEIVVSELAPGEKPPRKTATQRKLQRMFGRLNTPSKPDEVTTDEEQTPTQVFISKHATDVITSLEKEELTRADSDEDIEEALRAWYEANKTKEGVAPLPEDLSTVISTIKPMLKEE